MPEHSLQSRLPCVIEIGFAGSRRLFDVIPTSAAELEKWEQQLEEQLVCALQSLRSDLRLTEDYFFCGVSQIAIGADMVFTRACKRLNIPQRIFLPQPRDVYLAAGNSNGEGDFSAEDRVRVEGLLASTHIIQERVVSDADNRHARFEDCNREILRASDVVICLFGAGTDAKPGGTDDMFNVARAQGKAVLELRVRIGSEGVELDSKWHGAGEFRAPSLPTSIQGACLGEDGALSKRGGDGSEDGLPSTVRPTADGASGGTPSTVRATNFRKGGVLPSVSAYCDAVKSCASQQARKGNALFSRAALMIIGTHVFATLCAAVALAGHAVQAGEVASAATHFAWWLVLLLGMEIVALVVGFSVHRWVHHARPAEAWAISRLLAEINRSVKALGDFHMYPAYLFNLRLPREVTPLLRTITILHLHTTKAHAGAGWQSQRDAYLANRLTNADPRLGQIEFYKASSARERRRLARLNGAFLVCSALAIVATIAKLVLLPMHLPAAWQHTCTLLGAAAIFLPTLAVGALSWAAAKEYKARVQTFASTLAFLMAQKGRLEQTASRQEFTRLVEETESNLLGETADWFSRRMVSVSPG